MRIATYHPGDERALCARAALMTSTPATPRSAITLELQKSDLRLPPPPGSDEDEAKLTADHWTWRYLKNPQAKSPNALVAREGNQLLGHVAAVPSTLILQGNWHRAAQLFFDPGAPRTLLPALHRALFDRLTDQGVEIVYAAVSRDDFPMYQDLRFTPLFDVHARNLYLGMKPVSASLDHHAFGLVRAFAREMRRIRTKLIEVDYNEASLAHAARLLHANREVERPQLMLEKSEAWLRWRYAEQPGSQTRMLVLRRKAGAGINAFAIVRTFEIEPGRTVIQLLDHGTREPGRRATAWLIGEVAMWGLAIGAEVLQGFAAAGSEVDQALVASGCIWKKRERSFMVRWLRPNPPALPRPFPTSHVDLRAGDVQL